MRKVFGQIGPIGFKQLKLIFFTQVSYQNTLAYQYDRIAKFLPALVLI